MENASNESRHQNEDDVGIENGPISSSSSRRRFGMIALVATVVTAVILIVRHPHMVNEKDDTEQKKNNEERSIAGNGEHYVVLEVLPHDQEAFTQGLTFWEGNLYEGTGMYGASWLRHVDPLSGKVLKQHSLGDKFFGEGIAHFVDEDGESCLIQLTWKEKYGFIYRIKDFELIREFTYNTTTGEGWGITYDSVDKEFVVSDGSSTLLFWDRDSLEEKRSITVQWKRNDGQTVPVRYINELEWDNGSILANVWYQNVLLRLSPLSGQIEQVFDFSSLYTNRTTKADCFNGVALTETRGQLYVTGKWWPHMYRVKLLI